MGGRRSRPAPFRAAAAVVAASLATVLALPAAEDSAPSSGSPFPPGAAAPASPVAGAVPAGGTASDAPAPFPVPTALKVLAATRQSIRLKWNYTSSPGGKLAGFRIFYFHHQSYEDVKTVGTSETAASGREERRRAEAGKSGDDVVHFYELTGLEPYTFYEIWVKAIVNGEETAESAHLKANTDVAEPSAPTIRNATCHGNGSLYVEWIRPNKFHKAVDSYMLYYRKKEEQAFDSIPLEASEFEEVQKFLINNLSGGRSYVLKVCAGTKSLNSPNLPVWGDPSAEWEVFLPQFNCVDDGVTAAGQEGELSVGMVAGAICAVVFLLLACVGFVIWRSYCKSAYYSIDDLPRSAPPTGIPDWEDAPGPTSTAVVTNSTALPTAASSSVPAPSGGGGGGSLPVEQLGDHVSRLHADSDIGFAREYEEIQKICVKEGPAAHDHCSHPDNKCKNRYLNIVAYDHSRVLLSPLPGQKKTSDYINANYIDGFQQFHAYIGTQGPLEETCEAFWRMVWEQNVHVIVMITNLVERGRRKCDMYWPKDDNPVTYGSFEVHLDSEMVLANYTVRRMKLKHLKLKKKRGPGSGERQVVQFHYTSWPDHGVPSHPLPVLSFIRKSSNLAFGPPSTSDLKEGSGGSLTPRGGPVIVHCSAGVGRTGTYIAIDAVLRQIKATGRFNVFGLLCHMRRQRNYLVQTEEQYVFIHDALLEAIRSGDTEIESACINSQVERLITKSPNKADEFETLLDKQFSLLTAFAPSEFHYASAKKSYNLKRCRDPILLPVETSRVALSPRPGVEGSDFINATWLHGHRKLREFVVTQHPSAETKGEFWRMLWDHNAQTVVLLTSVDEDDEFEQDTFRVRFTERAVHEGHSTLDFVLSSSQDDYELTARVIHCPEWPSAMAMANRSNRAGANSNGSAAGLTPPSNVALDGVLSKSMVSKVFDVLKLVQDWHLEYQRGPLVVVDKCGGTEAATFCALTTLCNQLETDNAIDVYQVAKLYHDKRPGIWKSKDDILFLYKAMEALVASDHAVNPVGHSSSLMAVSSHCGDGDVSAVASNCNATAAAAAATSGGSLPPTSPTSQAAAALHVRPQSAAATTTTSTSATGDAVRIDDEEGEAAVPLANGSLPPPLVPERRHSGSHEDGVRGNGSLSNIAETSLASPSSSGRDDEKVASRRPLSMPPPATAPIAAEMANGTTEPPPNGCVIVMPPALAEEEEAVLGNGGGHDEEDEEDEMSETAALTAV